MTARNGRSGRRSCKDLQLPVCALGQASAVWHHGQAAGTVWLKHAGWGQLSCMSLRLYSANQKCPSPTLFVACMGALAGVCPTAYAWSTGLFSGALSMWPMGCLHALQCRALPCAPCTVLRSIAGMIMPVIATSNQ
jgi:hypothetical protein